MRRRSASETHRAVVAQGQAATTSEVVDEAYKDFVVPDDLMVAGEQKQTCNVV